jgi:hypothetical protein
MGYSRKDKDEITFPSTPVSQVSAFSNFSDYVFVIYTKFEVLTAVTMKMTVLKSVPACNLADIYQHFERICCLHLHV